MSAAITAPGLPRALCLFATLAALGTACRSGNRAPRFMSINEVHVDYDLAGEPTVDLVLAFEPGSTLELRVEVRDPEGGAVDLWFPEAPPGFDFAPRARKGSWAVPEDLVANWWDLVLIAEDGAEPSGAAVLMVECERDGGADSGG